jgi:hypothetical protein
MPTPVDDIVSAFSQVHGTESEKLEWLRQCLATFSEGLAADIEASWLRSLHSSECSTTKPSERPRPLCVERYRQSELRRRR